MPIEINFGERFGKIIIERKKGVRGLLRDLTKDERAISDAIEKYKLTAFVKKSPRGFGDEDSSLRILIMNTKEPPHRAGLIGYKSVSYSLFVDGNGRLTAETRYNPRQTFGDIALGVSDETLNLKYLPEWIPRLITRDELEERIDSLFYPKR